MQRDNCFPCLEHPERAQHLMDQQLRSDWPMLLGDIARSLNPLHTTMFPAFPMEYYWSTYQSERLDHDRLATTGEKAAHGAIFRKTRCPKAGCPTAGHPNAGYPTPR